MWQDGLALLIVVIAGSALLRLYAPAGWFRFGARRGGDDPAKNAATAGGGCGGCAAGSSCAKVRADPNSSSSGRDFAPLFPGRSIAPPRAPFRYRASVEHRRARPEDYR